jgi:hypothetical protein
LQQPRDPGREVASIEPGHGAPVTARIVR